MARGDGGKTIFEDDDDRKVFIARLCMMEWGKERRIEGNATEISLRTYHRGLILKDRSFPRREVTDIRASVSGSSGSTPIKRVELIVGDRSEEIASWIDGDEADALVRKVREALGR